MMNEPSSLPHAPYPPPLSGQMAHQQRSTRFPTTSSEGGGGNNNNNNNRVAGGDTSSSAISGNNTSMLHSSSSNSYSSNNHLSAEDTRSQQVRRQYGQRSASTSGAPSTTATSSSMGGSGGRNNKQQLPSRIAFVPGAPYSDLYGAVNCCSPVGIFVNRTTTTEQDTKEFHSSSSKEKSGGVGAASRLKYGPPLLEIRRMKCSLYLPNYNPHLEEEEDGNNGQLLSEEEEEELAKGLNRVRNDGQEGGYESPGGRRSYKSPSLFQHETILVSRGIPGLGGNVSSTCLDFQRPLTISSTETMVPQRQQNPVVRCATGLTSGALCIHTLSNLLSNYSENTACASSDYGAPSSTVAHYPTRQQRPATSVAWRPGGGGNGTNCGNLVAIGLVGAGGASSHYLSSGTSGGIGAAAARGASGMGGMGGSKSTLASMGVAGIASSSMSSLVIGSPSSSRSSTGSIASSAQPRMMGGGLKSQGMGGDRDFGALVWDIEAQSSVVSGAGTVGGGAGANKGMMSPLIGKKGLSSSASVGGLGKSGAGGGAVPIKTPAYKYAHNSGVESLAWLSDGQILAVGCQKRNVQLYDLRVSGTNSPPISVFAHTEAVAGIVPDISSSNSSIHQGAVFATFGRNVGEPVKIWDARMMDSTLGEIVVPQTNMGVSAIAWSIARPGVLSISVGDSIRNYDTRSPGSRALPVGVSYLDNNDVDDDSGAGGDAGLFVKYLAYQPQFFRGGSSCSTSLNSSNTTAEGSASNQMVKTMNPFEFYPHRTLAVSSQGQIQVIPESQAAPLAISKRDGRVATSLGGTVWIGPTTEGPSAMEGQSILTEDISARMMRRARCVHASRYSTDASDNVLMLEEEKGHILAQQMYYLSNNQKKKKSRHSSSSSKEFNEVISNIDQLLHCWRWIALVEYLSIDQRSNENEMGLSNDITAWPAKGLVDAGVLKLLRMSSRDVPEEGNNWMDTKSTSDTLHCDVFDSPMRRAALNACGWIKKYGVLQDLLDECEGRGEFERAAALAVWHGDLNACVSALQRGADDVRSLVEEGGYDGNSAKSGATRGGTSIGNCESYSETLSLIAMCVAGFNVTSASDGTMKTTNLWSNACDNLLRRPDIAATDKVQLPGVAYLRAILLFLQNIGSEAGFDKTIYNEGLSLADRVGFACRFLPRANLYSFLDASMRKCIKIGNLEGLLITGLDKRGIGLLQSYMDRNSDVQTAALISCRVVLPMEWTFERRMSLEWLESYRLLLNGLQMWNSRAAFDVGRFEHLRRLKQGGLLLSATGRHFAAKKQHQKDKPQANNNFPPQLWARCNYCNASLPLSKMRRQEGIANSSWLSRQKPILTCCPQCKKPLPRCSICLLSLGCLNPYMELQRERNQYPRGGMSMLGNGGGGNVQNMEDLSGLASLPFATWFSWCMRCKHGGHAHHLCGWFEKNATCAVSGCDCRCQFDGIEKLSRPGLQ